MKPAPEALEAAARMLLDPNEIAMLLQSHHTSDSCHLILTVLGSIALAGAPSAAQLVVTSGADAGPGSLRAAIELANARLGADTIEFDMTLVEGTIVLASPLMVTDDLTLRGPGADRLTVSGGGRSRVLDILAPVAALEGLTLADGFVARGDGAAVRSWHGQKELTIAGCHFVGNRCPLGAGGAVFSTADYSKISACTFTSNQARDGGALFNDGRSGSAAMVLLKSTLTSNSAVGDGGAIHNAGSDNGNARLTAYDCTFTGNEVSGPYGSGGAIYSIASNRSGASLQDGNAEVVLEGCSLGGNSASAGGGALSIVTNGGADTLVDVHDSIIEGNSVRGFGAVGGAIQVRGFGSDVALTLSHSTVDGNFVAAGPDPEQGLGGGLYFERNRFSRVTITQSRITNNAALVGGGVYLAAGDLAGDSVVSIERTTLQSNEAGNGLGFFDAATELAGGTVVASNYDPPGE